MTLKKRIPYSELLEFADTKQIDSLIRWLEREGRVVTLQKRIPYTDLLEFADTKQVDSLIRWLDREGIPYILDSRNKPAVLWSSIQSRVVAQDAEKERVGFAPVHNEGQV